MGKPLKPKKKCCKSKPRCKRCPVRLKNLPPGEVVESGPWPPASSPVARASSGRICATSCCARPPRHLRRQPRDRLAGEHRAHPRARVRHLQRRHHRAVLRRRAGRLRLPPRLAGLADRLPAAAAAHAEGRLATARTTRSGLAKRTARASCSPRRARSTATRRSTRSPRPTGATSTRSARAASTTRPSATPRR